MSIRSTIDKVNIAVSSPEDASIEASMGLSDHVSAVMEMMQVFAGSSGFKGLLRRFADLLGKSFAVHHIGFARISLQRERMKLKRRLIRSEQTESYDDSVVANLESSLPKAGVNLSDLRDGLSRIELGDRSYSMMVVSDPAAREGCLVFWEAQELGAQSELLLELIVKHLQNESRWWRKLDKTQAMLYRDDLTNLYNTRYFEMSLDAELRRAQRFPNQFCLLFIDLDGFKPINDTYGHLAGSSVLQQVAEVLRDSVREVDIPIRYGGDEFVVVLLGATSSKGLLAAERIRKRIEQKDFVLEDGAVAHVTASIGIAAYPEHGHDRDTLLKMADETMYNSKRNGKNRVTIVGEVNPLIDS